jgi:hypothetical protein
VIIFVFCYTGYSPQARELGMKDSMIKVNLDAEKIGDLAIMGQIEKRFICEQEYKEKRITLHLEKKESNGDESVALVGVAYEDDILKKVSILGDHKPNKEGADTVVSSIQPYTFDALFELIIY